MKMENCFECNKPASEKHHVIPKVLGGTKTISLCTSCHGKVHGTDRIRHRELQKIGIEKAKKNGVYKGRKIGTKSSISLYFKRYPNTIKLLIEKKHSLRSISRSTGRSINTVRKINSLLEENNYYK